MSEKARGRPRDESVDRRIIEATLDLLDEGGLSGLSIEAVAAEAGVAKTSIYRRWDSKEELVVDAIASVIVATEFEETGDIRVDLISVLEAMTRLMTDSRAGGVFPWLVGEIAAGTAVGKRYVASVIAPRRRFLAGMLQRAQDRGDLRPDVDPTEAVQLIIGPVLMMKITGGLGEVDPDWAQRLVDLLLGSWQGEAASSS